MKYCQVLIRTGLVVSLAGALAACGNGNTGNRDGATDTATTGDGTGGGEVGSDTPAPNDANDGGPVVEDVVDSGPIGDDVPVVVDGSDGGPVVEDVVDGGPIGDDVVDGGPVVEDVVDGGPAVDDVVDGGPVGGGDGGDGGPVMTDGGAEAGCAAGTMACTPGGACIELQRDPANCGMCGRVCTAGQTCTAGVCGCATGSMMCGDRCVDPSDDAANCGMCGRACSTGQVCTMGACACPAGQTSCGTGATATCINTAGDNNNCGACGNVCPMGRSCVMGACACPMGQTSCGTGATATCINTTGDNNNCGACGNVCAAGRTCVDGACACPMGQTSCGTGATATCVNTASDNANCGACGMACTGGATCTAGACACPTGQMRCGTGAAAACTDTATDSANCGACGMACPSGQVCSMGMCRSTCTAPTVPCGSGATMTCANTQNDDQNCGACGTVCGTVPNSFGGLCTTGTCRPICTSGFGNCNNMYADGCEVNLTNNVNNCGACGNTCPASATNASAVVCQASVCRPTCQADTATTQFRDCNLTTSDGCETNILNTNAHCGACGNACTGGQTCIAGSCTAVSCNELHTRAPALPSGVYTLDPDGTGAGAPFQAYCDMTNDGGGWTLALKVNGTNGASQFLYASPLWTNATTLNTASRNVTELMEAKFEPFSTMPFTNIRLVMRQPIDGTGTDRAIVLPWTGASLLARFSTGSATPADFNDDRVVINRPTVAADDTPATYGATVLATRARWTSLFPASGTTQAGLQANCNAEGFNMRFASDTWSRVRLGMVANENGALNCDTPDSFIGIGGDGSPCQAGTIASGNSCGCTCTPGDRPNNSTFSFVFIR